MGERPRRISRQKFPKRTRILSIPSKPYSFHSVHSAIGSRMNGMIFRSFRKRNSSQKNTNTVYSEYSYSGIVPKERALWTNIAIVFSTIDSCNSHHHSNEIYGRKLSSDTVYYAVQGGSIVSIVFQCNFLKCFITLAQSHHHH